jgi:hypothetical protein
MCSDDGPKTEAQAEYVRDLREAGLPFTGQRALFAMG